MDVKKILKKITSLPGVSGREEKTSQWLVGEFEKYCDRAWIHPSQSVIGYKKAILSPPGNGGERTVKKLMFAAHLDQIGLVVSKIEKGGFLRIIGIGYDPKVLLGQPVLILGREEVTGVISFPSISTLVSEKSAQIFSIYELYIDTGLDEEEVNHLIRVGDLVKIDVEPMELENDFYSAPALDDRSCVVALLVGMERLMKAHSDCDLYFVATSGEESTGKGATTTAWDIDPDLAVVMDVTFGIQSGVAEPNGYPVGKGLTLSIGPLFDEEYRQKVKEIADTEKIKLVSEPDAVGFGTDAATIRATKGGIPVVLVGLPLKSMHTPVEILSLPELKELGRLVAAISTNINNPTTTEDAHE